jgi:hypothetical protein
VHQGCPSKERRVHWEPPEGCRQGVAANLPGKSQYSSMYAEKIRLKEKAERKRRTDKDNEVARRARDLRTRIDKELLDKTRRSKKA